MIFLYQNYHKVGILEQYFYRSVETVVLLQTPFISSITKRSTLTNIIKSLRCFLKHVLFKRLLFTSDLEAFKHFFTVKSERNSLGYRKWSVRLILRLSQNHFQQVRYYSACMVYLLNSFYR